MVAQVKICGVTTPEAIEAAADAGARYLGFMFYAKSPRAMHDMALARRLFKIIPDEMRLVGVFVNPTNGELENILSHIPLDLIQLHGDESPARVDEVRARFGTPIIKALPVAEVADLSAVPAYASVCDYFLFDAKPPKNVAALPGGNALSFDWTIMQGRTFPRPWFLAGGLKAENVQQALAQSGAPMLDVSSGVEDRPGHKSPALIRHFMDQVKQHAGGSTNAYAQL